MSLNHLLSRLRRRLRFKKWYILLPLALLLCVALPGQALQVRLTPNNPQLGDTIQVGVQQNPTLNSTPVVKMGQKTYSTYLTSGGTFRALLPTTPLDRPGNIRVQVTGEGETKNLAVQLRSRSFPTQRITLSGRAGQEATQLELDRTAALKALETPEKYWNGPFRAPNGGRISSVYGVRRYYNGKFANDYYHRGVDYAGGYGSPVIAPAAGRVALVGLESQGFRVNGNIIGIDHGQGVTSAYLHLSRINVREGDFVQAGQVIGAIGSTGASTGPHLHWGLYVHGLSVDPAPWRFQGIE